MMKKKTGKIGALRERKFDGKGNIGSMGTGKKSIIRTGQYNQTKRNYANRDYSFRVLLIQRE